MSILEQLSSSVGSMRQDANSAVAAQCVASPPLLAEIAQGLSSKNARLVGDCAEVMTKVAETEPALVVPYAAQLLGMLAHKNGRVRWESLHAFALAAGRVPDLVDQELDRLHGLICGDKSVIVRDYAIDSVAAYGATSLAAAQRAAPVLRDAVALWEGKHAARAITGLAGATAGDPALVEAAREIARQHAEHERPGVRKAARSALKKLDAGRGKR